MTQDLEWSRGQTEEWTLTIVDDQSNPTNLSTALKVEFEVKVNFGTDDPPALLLGLGTGLILRDQTISPGVVDLTATAAQTFALTDGPYAYDVFVTRSDGARKRTQWGALNMLDPVNYPP
jgi:hypothetical protein